MPLHPSARPSDAGLPLVVPGEVVEPNGPSVAILTLREVRPIADYGGLHEAEDVLRDTLAAGVYRVMLASPRFARPPFHLPWMRRAMGATRLAHPYRIEHHQRHGEPADVLIVLVSDLTDASVLVGLPEWHELGRQVVMHIGVVTEHEIRHYPELIAMLRRRVDALFAGSEFPPLGFMHSDRLHTVGVIPPLLDVLAFPIKDPSERSIDVFSPGAEPPGQHQLLRQWAANNDGQYQQDVGQLGAVTSVEQHRRIFTNMASRSRVFLTNFDQFNRRRRDRRHREVGSRFYEAMAAGCALAGDLPTSSRQFGEYVADAHPLQFPLHSERLPADVAAALGDPEESQRLGDAARAAALRGNDVAHRWQAMAEAAGIPVSDGITQRISALDELADQLVGPRPPSPEPAPEPEPDSAEA